MPVIDLVNQAQSSSGLDPQTLTQATTGSALDFSACQEPLAAVVQWGTPGAGQTSATIQIQECATTNGTFTAIAGMVKTITGTVAGIAVLRGLRALQYVEAAAVTVTGTTPSLAANVAIIGQRKYAPAGSGGFDNYPS